MRKVTLNGIDTHFLLEENNYRNNGLKYLALYVEESGELFMDITTNIEGAETILGKDEVLVKTWGENESFIKPLLECGLFTDTGKTIQVSDWCSASIWKYNPDK